MTEAHKNAEHTVAEHEHGENCGHEAVKHEDHVDYVHDGHRHAPTATTTTGTEPSSTRWAGRFS